MAKTRISLENVEEEPEAVIIRFPTEFIRRNTTKLYDGIPSYNIEVYKTIQENKYKSQQEKSA